MRPLRSRRAKPLSGILALPGDAAIAQRALIIAAMALGESSIENLPETAGTTATINALRALGAVIEKRGAVWTVSGLGAGGLLEPQVPLDFGAAPDAAALLMGAAGIYPFVSTYAGEDGPALAPLLEALAGLGVTVLEDNAGHLPVALRGPRTPVPGTFRTASGDAKAALLLAAVAIAGTTRIIESGPGEEQTENLLAAFGASIEVGDEDGARTVAIAGLPDLRAQKLVLPGDPAAAAFAMVAGLVVPGADLVIGNVLMTPARAGLLPTLIEMGGDIRVLARRSEAGEDVADIGVRHSRLHGVAVPRERDSTIAEDFPALAVAAAFASGDTLIEGLGDAREDGVLAAMLAGFDLNGVSHELSAKGLTIHGLGRITGGGMVHTLGHADAGLGFLVMGMATRDPVSIDDDRAIAARYPGLCDGLTALGAQFKRGAAP